MSQLRSTTLLSRKFDHESYERHGNYDLDVAGIGQVSATMTLRFTPPQIEVSFDEGSALDAVDVTPHYVTEALEAKGKGPVYNKLSDVFWDNGKARKALSFAVGSALRARVGVAV